MPLSRMLFYDDEHRNIQEVRHTMQHTQGAEAWIG